MCLHGATTSHVYADRPFRVPQLQEFLDAISDGAAGAGIQETARHGDVDSNASSLLVVPVIIEVLVGDAESRPLVSISAAPTCTSASAARQSDIRCFSLDVAVVRPMLANGTATVALERRGHSG